MLNTVVTGAVKTMCAWCETPSRMSRCGPKAVSVALHEVQPPSDGRTEAIAMGAYCCDSCNGLMIARGVIEDTGDHGVAFTRLESLISGGVTWHPRHIRSRDFPDVPSMIASAASEAYRCFDLGAHRAALAMSRSVVEATAKDRGFSSGGLFQKIEGMRDKGILRQSTCEAAHEVREWGNEMAHGDFVDVVTLDEAEAVLGLMTEVLQEVYQAPAALAKVKKIRQARHP